MRRARRRRLTQNTPISHCAPAPAGPSWHCGDQPTGAQRWPGRRCTRQEDLVMVSHPTTLWAIYEWRCQDRLTEAHQARLVAEARSPDAGDRSVVEEWRRLAGLALVRLGRRLRSEQRPPAMKP